MYIPHGNGGNVRHPSPLIDAPIKFKRFIGFGLVGRGDGATDALRSLVNETRRLGAGQLAGRPIEVVSSAAGGKFHLVVGNIAPR